MATFRGGLQGQSLHAEGGRWQLRDATGQVIAEAGTVVLANAADALRLMQACHWPVQSVRGQISLYRAASPDAAMNLPRLPLAGAGYLLPDIDMLPSIDAVVKALGLSPLRRYQLICDILSQEIKIKN